MTERIDQIKERKNRLTELYPTAQLVVGINGWREAHLTEDHLEQASRQVSAMIDQYNTEHQNEMLPKSPEVIRDQMKADRSIMIVHRENGHVEVICHGTIYPAFEDGEDSVLGMQVIEVGSLIVPEDYRKHGMGSLGNLLLLSLSDEFPNSVALATVKQQNTAWAFGNARMQPVSFWQHPYLSYLTCSCSHCSEREGHSHCSFRRSPDKSTTIELASILDRSQPPRKMDCTLVLDDTAQAQKFEARCQELHEAFYNTHVDSVNPNTMRDAMDKMRIFFDTLRDKAKNG